MFGIFITIPAATPLTPRWGMPYKQVIDDPSIQQIDHLAERVLRSIAPLRIEIARSPRDLECAYRLRFRTAVDRGWIDPAQLPSGLEKDGHDDSALQIVALKGDTVVGTTRIIFPSPGRNLPSEELFMWRAGGRAEVGRVCRDAACASGLQVFSGLLSKVWVELRKRGFTECCGAAAIYMIRMYEAFGWAVERVAPPRFIWGEERWPVVIRPLESSERLTH